MSPQVEHPSFLALDSLRTEDGSQELRAHVASCAACTAHLEQMARPVVVPVWARALEERPRGWRALFDGGRRWAWAGALAGVMAVLVVLVPVLRTPPVTPDTYVGIKSVPTVVVHVRHGQAVSQWDNAQPLNPGDSVRLEVAANGFAQVLVGSRTAAGGFTTLYSGVLPEGGALLPASWRLDAEGEAENLVVLLSRAPLSPESLQQALTEHSQTPDVWVTELRLPKRSTP